jgi:membrane-anchored glycerophosphoryl diester phosphodiesterase (GDPDase)
VDREGKRVTDNSPWQSPSGEPTPPAPPFSGYAPATQASTPPPPPPGAWTPPPKPGLIPLRPLGLGDILGGSFRVLRRNPRPIIGVSLLIKGVVAIITIAVVGLVTVYGLTHAFDVDGADGLSNINFGSIVQSYVSSIVTFILGLVADAILLGIITLEVARGTLGEKLPLAGLWRRARGRIWALVGWSAAIGGVGLVGVLVIAVVIGVLVATGGTAGIVIGVLLGILAFFAAIVLAAWLGTKLSLVPSVLLLERTRLGTAIRRSWALTRGYFWRTFGIELLVAVIVGLASSIVLLPVTFIIGLITLSSQTSVGSAPDDQTTFITFTVTTVLSAIVGAITAIISTSATSLIYIDLRIRKEGLDLELMRYVEGREIGSTDLPDPYAPRPTP